jgi:hydrogenase nickel incorporation protein HypA/HybF
MIRAGDSHLHEASVARNLVELVSDELAAAGCPPWVRVALLRVRIGRLNSVAPGALRSAFEVAKRRTPLHEARMEIEFVELRVWCERCACERNPTEPTRLLCPTCGGRCPKLLRGSELELASIELAHEEAAAQ